MPEGLEPGPAGRSAGVRAHPGTRRAGAILPGGLQRARADAQTARAAVRESRSSVLVAKLTAIGRSPPNIRHWKVMLYDNIRGKLLKKRAIFFGMVSRPVKFPGKNLVIQTAQSQSIYKNTIWLK